MNSEIPPHIENRIRRFVESHPGETPENVLEKTLDQLEAIERHVTSDELIKSFQKYRGMVEDWTFEEMMADRRAGLR